MITRHVAQRVAVHVPIQVIRVKKGFRFIRIFKLKN